MKANENMQKENERLRQEVEKLLRELENEKKLNNLLGASLDKLISQKA